MAPSTKLFFLDFGLSNMKNGKLSGRILTCDEQGGNLSTVIDRFPAMPDGIGITQNRIYYTSMGNPTSNNGYISRLNLDGENHEVIVPQGVTFTPKQLQVVPEHGKIYWCDREGMRVFRCNLDGSDIEVLVTTGETDQDRKDPRNCVSALLWILTAAECTGPRKVPPRATKAACSPPAWKFPLVRPPGLLLYRLPEPIDLDLDFEENVLYLTDRGDPPFGNSISRVELDPKKKLEKIILVRRLHEAIGLSLDLENRKMYFTDLLGALYKSDMDTSNEKVLFSDLGDLTGVTCLHG